MDTMIIKSANRHEVFESHIIKALTTMDGATINQKGVYALAQSRQQVLILYLENPDLESNTLAWSLFDATIPKDQPQMQTGDSSIPPYASVLDAMRDGWNVIQCSATPTFITGHEYDVGHLPFEYVLERKVTIA